MFTGIVQGLGTVTHVHPIDGDTQRIDFQADFDLGRLPLGASVAVDGVCLTLVKKRGRSFSADLGPETIEVTTLGGLLAQQRVHLEPALRLGDPLGGHLVSGHVDGVARVAARRKKGKALELQFDVPKAMGPFFVAKGSVCVDGVSLTVNRVDACRFQVMLIPHTLQITHLGYKGRGDLVNIEVDQLAKQIHRLVAPYLESLKPKRAARKGKSKPAKRGNRE